VTGGQVQVLRQSDEALPQRPTWSRKGLNLVREVDQLDYGQAVMVTSEWLAAHRGVLPAGAKVLVRGVAEPV
jgi:hypothetical protein